MNGRKTPMNGKLKRMNEIASSIYLLDPQGKETVLH